MSIPQLGRCPAPFPSGWPGPRYGKDLKHRQLYENTAIWPRLLRECHVNVMQELGIA